ncbi:MAG TPA: AAA family ATPase, partial [Patescibacteria group bacterium]|nr:AAA family ATPase [Patescibacteria group bacterium]
TEAVRQRPYSVILLDEIEKANPDVFNILLQVLDDGRLTDSKGRTVNFKNTIVIMTSNLGTDIIQDKILEITETNRDAILAGMRAKIIELLKKRMRPEFLNRIDEIILFKPLTRTEIHQITKHQLDNLREKLHQSDLQLEVTEEALEWIAHIGYDVQYGARPLRRAIQKYIADPLAMKILGAEFVHGDTVKIDVDTAGTLRLERA